MKLVPENVLSFFSDSKLEFIETLADSPYCKTFLVTLENATYILKCFPYEVAIRVVPLNEEVTHFLFVNGFDKISRKFLALDDSTHYESEDGRFWTAQEFIQADPPFDWKDCIWTEDHAREAGSVLAEMHLRAVYVEHDLTLYQINTAVLSKSRITEERTVEKALEAMKVIGEQLPDMKKNAQNLKIEKMVEKIFEELAAPSGESAHFGTMENWLLSATVLNHGDYHPGNVLFMDGIIKAVIDFDYASFNTPAIDLGYALFMFANKTKMAGEIDSKLAREAFSEEMARAFLDGYFQTIKKMESVQNYSFEGALKILKPRMKLAALYTLFWVEERLSLHLAQPKEGKPMSREVLTFNHEKLDKIARFCLSCIV